MKTLEKQIRELRLIEDISDPDIMLLAPDKEAIDKIVKEIEKMKEYVSNKLNIELPTPEMTCGPKRSVDAWWKTDEYEILLNIKVDEPSSYYGDSSDKTASNYWEIRGKL